MCMWCMLPPVSRYKRCSNNLCVVVMRVCSEVGPLQQAASWPPLFYSLIIFICIWQIASADFGLCNSSIYLYEMMKSHTSSIKNLSHTHKRFLENNNIWDSVILLMSCGGFFQWKSPCINSHPLCKHCSTSPVRWYSRLCEPPDQSFNRIKLHTAEPGLLSTARTRLRMWGNNLAGTVILQLINRLLENIKIDFWTHAYCTYICADV